MEALKVCMKGNLIKIKEKDLEGYFGMMELIMLANGKMTWETDMEY